MKHKRERHGPIRAHVETLGDRVRCTVMGMEPRGLNGPRGLLRGHWSRLRRDKLTYQLVMAGLSRFPVEGPGIVWYRRSHRAVPLDQDNLAASAKPVLDALVTLGAIENDNPNTLSLYTSQQKRVRNIPEFVVELAPDLERGGRWREEHKPYAKGG